MRLINIESDEFLLASLRDSPALIDTWFLCAADFLYAPLNTSHASMASEHVKRTLMGLLRRLAEPPILWQTFEINVCTPDCGMNRVVLTAHPGQSTDYLISQVGKLDLGQCTMLLFHLSCSLRVFDIRHEVVDRSLANVAAITVYFSDPHMDRTQGIEVPFLGLDLDFASIWRSNNDLDVLLGLLCDDGLVVASDTPTPDAYLAGLLEMGDLRRIRRSVSAIGGIKVSRARFDDLEHYRLVLDEDNLPLHGNAELAAENRPRRDAVVSVFEETVSKRIVLYDTPESRNGDAAEWH